MTYSSPAHPTPARLAASQFPNAFWPQGLCTCSCLWLKCPFSDSFGSFILQDSAQCQLLRLLLPHPTHRPPTVLTLCFSFMACNCLFICLYTFSLFCCPTMMWALCKQTLVGRAAKHLGWRAHRRADWERWHLGCPQVGKQMFLWSYRGQGVTRKVNLIQGEAFHSPSDQTMEKTMRWEYPITGVMQAEIGQPWSGLPDVLGPCRMDSLPYMG